MKKQKKAKPVKRLKKKLKKNTDDKKKDEQNYEPYKIKGETLKAILKSIEVGMNITDACELAGIDRTTFYEWKKKEPTAHDQLRKTELRAKKRNITLINSAALTDWRAAAWTLERKFPNEYSLRKREPEADTEKLYSAAAHLTKVANYLKNPLPDRKIKDLEK